MNIHLSANDGIPVYLQIVNQVKYLVASGRLQPGDELAPIRSLAEKLVINPNTVGERTRNLKPRDSSPNAGPPEPMLPNGGGFLARAGESLRILTRTHRRAAHRRRQ